MFVEFKQDILNALRNGNELEQRYASLLWRMWQDREKLFEQYYLFLQKRSQFLLSISNTIRTDLILQAQDFREWRTREFVSSEPYHALLVRYAPQLYYKINDCEICLDIENKDKENLKKCLEVLKLFRIEPLVAFSGNKGFHVHFFITPEGYGIDTFVSHPQARQVTNEFYDFLLDFLKQKSVKDIDVNVKAPHWIRCLYSLNVKQKIGLKKPVNGKGEIPIWILPKQILESLKVRFKKRKEEEEFERKLREIMDEEAEKYGSEIGNGKVLDTVLKALERFKVREYTNYITYRCPFVPHQGLDQDVTDESPSFTFWKVGNVFIDWHGIDEDGIGKKKDCYVVYSPKKLYFKLKRRGLA